MTSLLERLDQLEAEEEAEVRALRLANMPNPKDPPKLADVGSSDFEQLQWLDARCVALGDFAMDRWWSETLHAFFESKKQTFAILAGLRAAKSTSILRPLAAHAIFTRHGLGKSVGVVPVLSARREEANDKFQRLQYVLQAAGYSNARNDDVHGLPGGIEDTYDYHLSSSGGGAITIRNVHGETIEFRCLPTRATAVVGYDGVSAFLDELDIWEGSAEKTAEIVEGLYRRFTTACDTARIFMASAWYPLAQDRRGGEKSYHRRVIETGDTPAVFVAQQGQLGAERDHEARKSLYLALASKPYGSVEKIVNKPNPESPSIPSWVTNPAATIEKCWAQCQSGDKTLNQQLATLFEQYGCDYASPFGRSAGGKWDHLHGFAEAAERVRQYWRSYGGTASHGWEYDVMHRRGIYAPGGSYGQGGGRGGPPSL